MFLLSDMQVDRWVRRWWRLLLSGCCILVVAFSLPQGWGTGLFTGYMLISFGVYSVRARNWRIESGIWMYAALLVVLLGPCWIFFEYLNFRSLFPLEKNQIPQDLNWNRFKFLLDSFLSLAVLSFIVRFCISVAIKNWQLTGPYQVYECGLKAGQRLRLQKDLECRFEEGDRVLRKGSLCQVSNRVSPDPGVIWLSFSNGSIIPWYDDPTMFEHFERVD